MTFSDVSSLKFISKTHQTIKMMTRAGCSNNTKRRRWTPPNNHYAINTQVEAVKNNIEQSKTVSPRNIRPNLSKDEKVALKNLSKQDGRVAQWLQWTK